MCKVLAASSPKHHSCPSLSACTNVSAEPRPSTGLYGSMATATHRAAKLSPPAKDRDRFSPASKANRNGVPNSPVKSRDLKSPANTTANTFCQYLSWKWWAVACPGHLALVQLARDLRQVLPRGGRGLDVVHARHVHHRGAGNREAASAQEQPSGVGGRRATRKPSAPSGLRASPSCQPHCQSQMSAPTETNWHGAGLLQPP